MPNDALLQSIHERLPDRFSHTMLDGALHVLGQADNPMRAHQFAGTLRELIAHVLEVKAPAAEVVRCPWFKQDKEIEGPTRRQRALYTCRGGLTDAFLKNTLKLDPGKLHAEFSAEFQKLHKRTHVRPDTVLSDAAEVEDFVNDAFAALDSVFETIDDSPRDNCREDRQGTPQRGHVGFHHENHRGVDHARAPPHHRRCLD
jgi:hypothetical protein